MIRTILRQTAVFLFTSAAFVALAAPATASPASITVAWGDGNVVAVQSDKALSNVVILDCLGNVTKIESPRGNWFEDADGIVTIWVKSGNNHSNDGPGYGERFDQPMECLEVPTSTTTSTTTPSPQPTTTTTSGTPGSSTSTSTTQAGPVASPSTSTPTAPESGPTSSPTTLTELPRTGSNGWLIGVALWLVIFGGIIWFASRLLR